VVRGSNVRMGSRGHQARAACTAPTPALLPTPEGLGQRHAHGRNVVYTILVFFFLFFYFCGDQKMGYNTRIRFPHRDQTIIPRINRLQPILLTLIQSIDSNLMSP